MQLLKGLLGSLAWLMIGYIVSIPYSWLAGGFPTPLTHTVAALILLVPMLMFVKGLEMASDSENQEDRALGWGMAATTFFTLVIPIALALGNLMSIPPLFVPAYENRFSIAAFMFFAGMTGTFACSRRMT